VGLPRRASHLLPERWDVPLGDGRHADAARPRHRAIFAEPRFAVVFARISTHYALHQGFVEDGSLVAGTAALVGIPAVIIQGRYDLVHSPRDGVAVAPRLARIALHLLASEGHRLTGALVSQQCST
jgi:hypothetical protein